MADTLENSPVAAAKDVISSIFGSAACVYTGQVGRWDHLQHLLPVSPSQLRYAYVYERLLLLLFKYSVCNVENFLFQQPCGWVCSSSQWEWSPPRRDPHEVASADRGTRSKSR